MPMSQQQHQPMLKLASPSLSSPFHSANRLSSFCLLLLLNSRQLACRWKRLCQLMQQLPNLSLLGIFTLAFRTFFVFAALHQSCCVPLHSVHSFVFVIPASASSLHDLFEQTPGIDSIPERGHFLRLLDRRSMHRPKCLHFLMAQKLSPHQSHHPPWIILFRASFVFVSLCFHQRKMQDQPSEGRLSPFLVTISPDHLLSRLIQQRGT